MCLAAPIHKIEPKVMRQPQNQPIITDHVSVFAHPTDSYEIYRLTWNCRSPTKYIQVSSLFFLPFTFIFFAPKEKPPPRFCLSSPHIFSSLSLFRVSFLSLFFFSLSHQHKPLSFSITLLLVRILLLFLQILLQIYCF